MVPEVAKQEKKKRRVKPLLEPIPDDIADGSHAGKSKLARALGSCDYHSREKGVQALTRFLQRKSELEERDMLKIWKGLFYAFWHSDKQPVQAELATRLAAVLSSLQPQVAFLYFSCFVSTMRREWFGIDRLRLDKFLMLIRKFLGRMFKLLADHKWQKPLVTKYMDYLFDHVLHPADSYRAVGVAYHLADIFIPELKQAIVSAAAESGSGPDKAAVPGEVLGMLLQPFCKTLAATEEAPVLVRIREGVFDAVLDELRTPDEALPLRHLDTLGLAGELFGLGARAETRTRNREALYALSTALERTHAKRQRKEAAAAAAAAAPSTTHVDAGIKTGGKQSHVLESSPAAAAAATAPVAEAETSTKKKKRKASALNEVQPEAVGPSAAATEAAAAAAAAAAPKASLPKANGAVTQEQGRQKQQGATAPSPAPASALKKAKLVAVHRAGGAGEPEASAAGAAQQPVASSSAQPVRPSSASKRGGPADGQNGTAAAVPKAGDADSRQATPAAVGTGKAKAGGKSSAKSMAPSAKKRVQINLKKNLYFDFGGPVPPADVRTPQASRSKGGILKKKSGMAAPHSAPPKTGHSQAAAAAALPQHANGGGSADKTQQQRRASSAVKASRPRAALFF